MDKKTVVLIATHSSPLADGLNALLKALPQIDEVNVARNIEDTLHQLGMGKPNIVLIDSVLLGSKPEVLLENIASLFPETQRVLLVDVVQNVNWVPHFAEAILVKGVAPSALATIVTNLLSSKGEEDECYGSNP